MLGPLPCAERLALGALDLRWEWGRDSQTGAKTVSLNPVLRNNDDQNVEHTKLRLHIPKIY